MEKEFIPYEQALELKELGFNEPCFYPFTNFSDLEWSKVDSCYADFKNWNDKRYGVVSAPLYQQAFRWLRYKHNCVCEIIRKEDGNHSEFIGWVYIDGRKIDVVSYWDSKSYEEAELACLIKLIEIIKAK